MADIEKRDITILVADDEREIADLIEIYLRNDGYRVVKFYGGAGVAEAVENEKVSLALLDVMMQGVDGMTICNRIREKHNIPIIMVTAKSRDEDKIAGLTAGADDYITKPFNPAELSARVAAQLRRFINLNPKSPDGVGDLEIGGLALNKTSHTVKLYGERVELTPMEFDILYLLASNLGRVFSAEEIFCAVWGVQYLDNSNNTVMVHIRHIREKLGDGGKNPRFIKTVWGVGYKIEE